MLSVCGERPERELLADQHDYNIREGTGRLMRIGINRRRWVFLGIVIVVGVAIACGSDTDAPTATPSTADGCFAEKMIFEHRCICRFSGFVSDRCLRVGGYGTDGADG